MPRYGDMIAGLTSAMGIRPCAGCKERQAALNRLGARTPSGITKRGKPCGGCGGKDRVAGVDIAPVNVPDVSAKFTAENTTAANDQRVQALYGVIGNVATGGKVSPADAEMAIIGVVSLAAPEVGAMMAVGLGMLNLIESAGMSVFHALGWDAQGSTLADYEAHRCDSPPSDAQYAAALRALDAAPALPLPGMPWMNLTANVPVWDQAPAGSFVAFAARPVARNNAAYANCRLAIDQWTLLRQLALAWNNAHAGPAGILYMGQITPGVMAGKVRTPATPGAKAGWGDAYDSITDPLGRGIINMNTDGSGRSARYGFEAYPGNIPLDMQNLAVNMGPLLPQYVPHKAKMIGKTGLRDALAGMSGKSLAKKGGGSALLGITKGMGGTAAQKQAILSTFAQTLPTAHRALTPQEIAVRAFVLKYTGKDWQPA